MMKQEIGSEFHWADFECSDGLPFYPNAEMVFSGRTAIETVLKELPDAKSACLPSYCCESMLTPFQKAGIEVSFYDVYYDGRLCVNIDSAANADILLWCNYFGFRNEMPDLTAYI